MIEFEILAMEGKRTSEILRSLVTQKEANLPHKYFGLNSLRFFNKETKADYRFWNVIKS